MIFLPIVERELRAASRRRGTYWNRAVAALSAILVFAGTVWAEGRVAPKELGDHVFHVLSGLFLFGGLVAGIRFTADCMSEEKREGTLGLLFLTDLKGYDVVLGKLAATSLDAFYGLFAIFPVLAIPLLLGGVSIQAFWRMALVLASALFFSLAAGIFVSALSRGARKAMAGTLALVLLFHAGLPALGAWLAYRQGSSTVGTEFLLPSAGYAYALVFETPSAIKTDEFQESMAVILGTAWLFLALASLAARRSWQDKPAGALRARWQQRWQRWSYGDASSRAAFRRRLLNSSPCLWLGSRQRLKPMLVWAVLGLCACFWTWAALRWRDDWLHEGTYFATALALHFLLKLWVTSEACQRFGPDHRSGALELLLSTPLTVGEILRGQMLALRRQFLGPVLAVAVLDLVFMVVGARASGLAQDNLWGWVCWAGIVTLLADAYTLCWVGMWVGLVSKRPNRATSAVITRVMVLPWGAWIGLLLLVGMTRWWLRVGESWKFYLGLWFVLGMAADVYFCLWARSRLRRDLRVVATQRFVPGRLRLFRVRPRPSQSSPAVPPAVASET
jgi:ABC-type transport system involved in multi-copper enzyme maturation permease subunit